jgi:L-ribulose-5-phosphate 3-epimerase
MDSRVAASVGLYEKALPADWPWEKRLESAAEAGYSFVEISIDESEARLGRLAWPASDRADLRRAIANTGVSILTMCLSGHRKYPLGSRSPEIREEGLEIFRKAIDFAGDIGVRIVQVMGYDVFYEPSDDETKARFMDGMHQGIRWAGQAGMMLALENVDVPFVESLEQALEIVRTLNSPWFQLYSDMANLVAAGYHPPDQLRLAQGHIVAMHVKDGRPGVVRGVPFEAGDVPFEETFQTLAEIGFCGPLTVEMWADMDPSGDPLSSAAAARRLVARLIGSA